MSISLTHISRSLFFLGTLLCAGCPTPPETPKEYDPVKTFIVALPTSNHMNVDVPGVPLDELGNLEFANGLANTAVDEHSGLRKLVYHAVKDADRGLNFFLDPLREITQAVEPTVTNEEQIRAVWRYTDPDELRKMILVLEESDDGHLSYILVKRSTAQDDAPWKVQLFGTYTPWDNESDGSGSAWLNLEEGKILIIWTQDKGTREFTIHHHSVKKEGPQISTTDPDEIIESLTFSFTSTEKGEGSFIFGPKFLDIYQPEIDSKPVTPVPAPNEKPEEEDKDDAPSKPTNTSVDTVATAEQERLNVMVRWSSEGSGRIDAEARGNNIKQSNFKRGQLAECWDADSFERSYLYYMLIGAIDADQEVFAKGGDPQNCPYPDSLEILLPIIGKLAEDPALPPETDTDE